MAADKPDDKGEVVADYAERAAAYAWPIMSRFGVAGGLGLCTGYAGKQMGKAAAVYVRALRASNETARRELPRTAAHEPAMSVGRWAAPSPRCSSFHTRATSRSTGRKSSATCSDRLT